MSDLVLVILTSEGCGHCSQFRGNGVIGNGKPMHQYSFLESHINPLKKDSKLNIINIHFGSMSGNHNQIQVISKFTKKGKFIHQERYFSENGKTCVSVLTVSDKEKNQVLEKKKDVVVEGNKINWIDFLTRKIPVNIQNYSFFYPCFILFKKEDWKTGKNILGIPNAGFVVRNKDGTYGLEKSGQSLQQRNLLPQKMIIEAIKGELKFEPMKDFYVEPKVEEVEPEDIDGDVKKEERGDVKKEERGDVKKEERGDVKKEERIVTEARTFIIRSYHDE
jgi:hypothetical protein